jgi:hypothetical protein
LKNNYELSYEEEADIIKMIQKLVGKNNIKYVNQVKSLEKLLNLLDIKIININEGFKVKVITKK